MDNKYISNVNWRGKFIIRVVKNSILLEFVLKLNWEFSLFRYYLIEKKIYFLKQNHKKNNVTHKTIKNSCENKIYILNK